MARSHSSHGRRPYRSDCHVYDGEERRHGYDCSHSQHWNFRNGYTNVDGHGHHKFVSISLASACADESCSKERRGEGHADKKQHAADKKVKHGHPKAHRKASNETSAAPHVCLSIRIQDAY